MNNEKLIMNNFGKLKIKNQKLKIVVNLPH